MPLAHRVRVDYDDILLVQLRELVAYRGDDLRVHIGVEPEVGRKVAVNHLTEMYKSENLLPTLVDKANRLNVIRRKLEVCHVCVHLAVGRWGPGDLRGASFAVYERGHLDALDLLVRVSTGPARQRTVVQRRRQTNLWGIGAAHAAL